MRALRITLRLATRLLTTFLVLASANASGQNRAGATTATPQVACYDAEQHLGLVAGDPSDSVAAANTLRLNAALAATHAAGAFDFARGPRGPVLLPIVFAAKTFYFKGELKTAVKVGSGALIGGGGEGYPLGESDLGPRGMGGATTRFVRIDPTSGGAMLRLRGAGFSLKNIELYGRRPAANVHSGAGPRTPISIALEGRNFPATGKHHIEDIAIVDCEQAIAMLPGYEDDAGKQVAAETHADETIWGRITVFNCGRAVVSTNEQASWHHFQHLKVVGGAEPTEVIFDVERGGTWKIDMLAIGVANTTVLRVKDFSQNMSRFEIDGLYRDHFAAPDPATKPGDGGKPAAAAQRITLFEFAGTDPQPWKRWSVRMKGHFSDLPLPEVGFGAAGEPTFAGGFRYPAAELVKLNGLTFDPSGRYGTSIQLDINNLPAWIAAKYWPHGAYRLTAIERDLIPQPYAGLTVFVLDPPARGQRQPSGAGHYESWDGAKWTSSTGPPR